LLFISSVIGCGDDGEPRTCASPTTRQDRRPNKLQLSVATFNAEWLFWSDGNGGPSTKCPRDHSQGTCPWANKAQAEAHIRTVAEVLNNINADIIAFEEVQDCVVLQCLINQMGDNTYKPYLIPGTDTATDQNVGIISRVDPESALFRDEQRATIYREDSPCGRDLSSPSYSSGVSKHFIARFNVQGIGAISLIGLHFLAFPTDPERCIRREAQATVIKNIAQNEIDRGRQVIVLGDANDYDRDVLDASNSVPVSRVSRILKYDDEGSRVMYNVAEFVSQRLQRYSHWWDQNYDCEVQDGELTLIDHVLLTHGLRDLVSSVRIYNTIQGCDLFHSDHYPIKVVLDSSSTVTEQTSQEDPGVILTSVEQDGEEVSGVVNENTWQVPVAIIGTIVAILVVVGVFYMYHTRQGKIQESQQLLNNKN